MRISDWSSDVCSSDLGVSHRYAEDVALPDEFESGPVEDISAEILLRPGGPSPTEPTIFRVPADMLVCKDRKSVVLGKSVSVRVDLGGRRIINKKKKQTTKVTLKYTHI